jgi:hypothetical protein
VLPTLLIVAVGSICASFLSDIVYRRGLSSNNALTGNHIQPKTTDSSFLSTVQPRHGHATSTVSSGDPGQGSRAPQSGRARTLVLYIFSNTDKEYINNLRFFISNGIREGDGCDYIIVINVGEGSPVHSPPQPNLGALHVHDAAFSAYACA